LEEHAKVSRPLSHWESLDRRFRFGAQWGNKGHVYRVIESATLADLSELQGTYPSLEHDVGKITDGKAKKARKPAAPIVVYTDAAREGETNLWQYWDIFEKEFRYLKEFPGTSALSIDDSSVFETLESATPLLEAQIDDIASDILHLAEEQLTDREVAVISLYLGLKPPYVMKTLQEIGAILHIHLERVRQICRDALDKMDKDTVKTFF
jgi:DNA-binding CsgD family transcriptional regulator